MNKKRFTLFVVREKDNILALFPNEQRAVQYCKENMAHLTYQKEEWERMV